MTGKSKIAIPVVLVLALLGICIYLLLHGEAVPQAEKNDRADAEECKTSAGAKARDGEMPGIAPSGGEDSAGTAPPAPSRKGPEAGKDAKPKATTAGKKEKGGDKDEMVTLPAPDGMTFTMPRNAIGHSVYYRPKSGDCTVSGTVHDSSGKPVAYAEVIATSPDEAKKKRGIVQSYLIARTDDYGSFKGRIANGKWLLAADYFGLLDVLSDMNVRNTNVVEVELLEKEQKSGIVLILPFALADLASISGKVLDENGSPIAGASVWSYGYSTITNSKGEYKLAAVLPGERRAFASDRSQGHKEGILVLNVKAGDVLKNVDLALELEKKTEFWITGTVRNKAGEPIKDARISISKEDEDFHSEDIRMWHTEDIRMGDTDENGFFKFKNLEVNKVNIRAWAEGYESVEKEDVALPAQNVDFVLQREVYVTFKVVEVGTLQPVKTFTVHWCKPHDEAASESTVHHEQRGSEGRICCAMPPGEIVVKVEAPGYKEARFELAVPDQKTWEKTLQLEPSAEQGK